MIHARDHQTEYLFDPWSYLGPKRRRLMEASWAGVFREHILRELPVQKIAPYFSEGSGRPTKELYAALGSLILQQMHDLTDEETVAEFCFDIKWHYALDIPGESDESKYLSLKTLWALRHLVMAKGLDVELFNRTTELLAKAFRVDTSKQRIDSVHIRSNMKRLGRIGIFSRSIHVFLVNLKRQRPEIFETIDKELVDRYLTQKALECFSLVKPSESGKTLEMVARDLFSLVRRFREIREVNSLHSYNALVRVLKDQCRVKEEHDDQPAEVEVKSPKEVSSASLQNPSDPDAGYSGHKGQGYHAQVMETYCDSENEQIKERTLNLITHVEVEP
ncbi:MAG: transposase, partial [Deltaproteobacteria bacterium]|nr:transposase [Deltaproteobacteria bacterium]